MTPKNSCKVLGENSNEVLITDSNKKKKKNEKNLKYKGICQKPF